MKDFKKTPKHPNKESVQNVIFTATKISGFGFTRKYMLRASICKKNHLKWSYETQVTT